MADLDAILTNNRFPRTSSSSEIPQVILSTIELEQTCRTYRHMVASSVVWVVSFAVIIKDGSFDVRIFSCSSSVKSLFLILCFEIVIGG